MDPIGKFIATLHNLLGHDTAARIIGMPSGDKSACLLCQYERHPSPERKQAVINAIGRPS